MTREVCEELIVAKIKEIAEIYREYNPDGTYLTMSIFDGRITVNNSYYDEKSVDANKKICVPEY